uniref:Uncharacterized protein n=1 Tax=Globodera rostochiensis TaxID=31243 RepID=A0A914HZ45_GLORO
MSNHLTKPTLTFLLVLIVANVNGQYGYQYNNNQLYLQQQQQQSLQLCQQQLQNLQQQIFSLMQNQKEAGSVPSANSNNTREADAPDSENNLLDVAVGKNSSPNFVKSAFT